MTNAEPTTGSTLQAITKDTVAPMITIGEYSNNITSQNVSLGFQSNELGTYRVLVNNIDTGVTGTVSAINTTVTVSVPNAAFTINP